MKRVFYLSLLLTFFIISCNNDDDSSQEEQEVVENFYALTTGNNWKYEYFDRIGQTEEFESTGVFEAIEIIETQIIEGEAYYVFQSTTIGNENGYPPCAPEYGVTTVQKRDSLGYLIDSNHSILFSNENLIDYLISENNWGDIYGVLKEESETIEVDAGSFITNRNEIYALLSPNGETSPGRNNYYYSDGNGEIFNKYSSVSSTQHRWEKRLINFEIND